MGVEDTKGMDTDQGKPTEVAVSPVKGFFAASGLQCVEIRGRIVFQFDEVSPGSVQLR